MQKQKDVNEFMILYLNPLTGFWSMNKPKGGRGNKAPYTSTHVRVPDALLSEVETLKRRYFNPDEEQAIKPLTSIEDAMAIAKEILLHKKSARYSLEKLLTALYGGDVTL